MVGFVCPSVEAGLMDVVIPGMSVAYLGMGEAAWVDRDFSGCAFPILHITGCYCTLVHVCERVRLCMTGCLFSLVTAFILASRPLRMSGCFVTFAVPAVCCVCTSVYTYRQQCDSVVRGTAA